MRFTRNFLPTLRDVGEEAQSASHMLMLKTGMIRQLSAGVFSWLPLGYKVLKKVINILREEMDEIGAQEFLLPALNPIEIWEETGRVEAMGDVMFHLKNREGLVLAPTHEEIITVHARQHLNSYRDLPQIWYQVQTKFRNEPRPKSGVLRGRQFLMKDSYSLDSSWEGLDESYQNHFEAYQKIFDRCGLKYFVVGASSGAMGGKQSQEFMVESNAGEDECAISVSGYAANSEVATSALSSVHRLEENPELEEFATPNAKTINDLIDQFNIPEERCAKSVVYIIDSEPVLLLMRGNDELNETKLSTIFSTNEFRPAEPEELLKFTGAKGGSIGPIGLKTELKVIADNLIKDSNNMVSGANKDGFHFRNIDISRDCKIDEYHDLRIVKQGEPDPIDGSPMRLVKAIELGHIFKLGTKYSQALGANFLDPNGKANPIIMGSYGIGVERILACFIEQNHDENGIIWKQPLAPYHVHIISLNPKKFEEVARVSDKLYMDLQNEGFEVLYDDRKESPGIKFNDADLLGMPIQLIIGNKGIEQNELEIKIRSTGDRKKVRIDQVLEEIKKHLSN